MSKPRYAIVRVDNSCPAMLDDFGCIVARNMLHCKCGEDTKNYGDTKEQLIKKAAQVLFKEKVKHFNKLFGKEFLDKKWKQIYLKEALKEARKIIEFLGVEE